MKVLYPINLDNWRCPIASLLREIAVHTPDIEFYSGSNPREDEKDASAAVWAKPHIHRISAVDLALVGFDIVHHASVTPRGMLAVRLAKIRSFGRVRHLFTANLEIRREDTTFCMFERAVASANAVVGVSNAVQEDVKKQFGRDCLEVVPNGYDANFFQPGIANPSSEFDQPYVLWVGAIEPRKRPDIFLEVAKRRPETLFIMAGPLIDAVPTKLVEAMRKQKNVLMTGSVGRPRLKDLLANAGAFLFPSDREGLPLSVIEALAMGVPVIARPVSSLPELLKDGENGFLLSASAPDAWADKIGTVLTWSSAKRDEWRQRVHEDTKERYSWPGIARKYAEIYRSMMR
ncbi:MAG: glycosyltransferase family 4 protein [Verrucomicrobiota bacterium]